MCSNMDELREQHIISDKEKILYDITYMESKNNTNESIYKTETDSRKQKTNLWLAKGRGNEGQVRSMGLTDINYYT